MSSLVYFNGLLRREDEVIVSMLDRSYLYGEGLMETLKATRGFIPFLPEHLDRLFRGMDLLQMKLDVSAPRLEFALYQTLHHNRFKDAYLRLTLSRENVAIGNFDISENNNLIVVARPLAKISAKTYDEGVSAMVIEKLRIAPDLLSQIKSTNYLRNVVAQKFAREAGVDEGLLLNTTGRIAEGATSNLFVYDGNHLMTPSLEEGALPGVTRRIVLALAAKHGIKCFEGPVTIESLAQAHEAFLTSAIKEIVPLTRFNSQPIGTGKPGPLTLQLIALYRDEVQFRSESLESRRWGVE